MGKVKRRCILLEKEISCWKEFSSWNPAFQIWVSSTCETSGFSCRTYLYLPRSVPDSLTPASQTSIPSSRFSIWMTLLAGNYVYTIVFPPCRHFQKREFAWHSFPAPWLDAEGSCYPSLGCWHLMSLYSENQMKEQSKQTPALSDNNA